MENTPRLSSSVKSSPRTPHSIDQTLFQTPPRNRPELKSFGAGILPERAISYQPSSSPPPLQSPRGADSIVRKRTLEANVKMRRMSPRSSLTLDDVVEGNEMLKGGLSQLPNELFNKFYIAKRASRDRIVSHLSMTLCKIDALEKMKDLLIESQRYNEEQLASANKELELFMHEAQARNSNVTHDIAYHHAAHADELAALTAANMELSHLSTLSKPEFTPSTTDESDSDMSDDLVYEDDEEDGD